MLHRRVLTQRRRCGARVGGLAEQYGKTALMRSARNGHNTTVTELVRLGANLDAVDSVRSHRRIIQ